MTPQEKWDKEVQQALEIRSRLMEEYAAGLDCVEDSSSDDEGIEE